MLVKIIAVDFDHTIVDGDKPLKGAKEGLQALRDKGFSIWIHSCNGREWIERILNNHEIPYDYIWDGQGKPIAYAYIDDRGIGFNGDWNQTVAEVEGLDRRRAKIREWNPVE